MQAHELIQELSQTPAAMGSVKAVLGIAALQGHIPKVRDATQAYTPGFLNKKLFDKKLQGWISVKKHNCCTRGERWKSTSQKNNLLFLFRTTASEASRNTLFIRIYCLNRYCFERPLFPY